MKEEANALQVAGDQVIASHQGVTEMMKWVGRHQAFGLMASQNAAAQAQCLKHIKESRQYEELGCTWEQFCDRELGVPRRTADELIKRLNEFGTAYFAMSEIIKVSSATYRLAAGAITDQGMEIDGEVVPLTKANADRISEAINAIRKEAQLKSEQLTEAKAETEKARKERDNAKKAAKSLDEALTEARAKEANRYKSATPHEKLLIEADEAIRYATGRVFRMLHGIDSTVQEKELARAFVFNAVKAFYTSCGITDQELFFADAIPAGRSPLDEHMAAQPSVRAAIEIAKELRKK